MKKILKYLFLSITIIAVIVVVNFLVVKKLDKAVLETEIICRSAAENNTALLIPSKFNNGGHFYVKIALLNGDTLLAFCDTGGGICMIPETTLEKKHLGTKIHTGIVKGLRPLNYILFSDLAKDERFPKPCPLRSFVIRHPFARVTEPYLIAPPLYGEIKFMIHSMPEMEAFLGQGFFMDKSWTIDYPQQKVWVNTPLLENEKNDPNVQTIGFKKNSINKALFGHPSMYIEVNGERIDVLFDTGASLVLSEEGKKLLQTDSKAIAGSFIAASVFDKWRKEHPEWKLYPNADLKGDVIEVPVVKIGGYEVGPVLFAKRKDENWSEGMIYTMDKIVKGAIGGSCLKYLKVTIDYNSELIKFEK